ncbi:MAG TPA: L,D-transpeptidase family protein [Pyrinomonadaceae bacterium]
MLAALSASQALAGTSAQKGTTTRLTREEVSEAERRLGELGYWPGEADGIWDLLSRHALVAFQKVEGRERTGKLTRDELRALRDARPPQPLEGGQPHVEIDIRRQVLFVVDGVGAVVKVLPVSTGSEESYFDQGKLQRAHTPRGRFSVGRKINGWRRSTLGLLYYPSYFSGGFAIHGSPSVPAYPASHGCVRIPMFAAKEFSEMVPVGTLVIVHDGG